MFQKTLQHDGLGIRKQQVTGSNPVVGSICKITVREASTTGRLSSRLATNALPKSLTFFISSDSQPSSAPETRANTIERIQSLHKRAGFYQPHR